MLSVFFIFGLFGQSVGGDKSLFPIPKTQSAFHRRAQGPVFRRMCGGDDFAVFRVILLAPETAPHLPRRSVAGSTALTCSFFGLDFYEHIKCARSCPKYQVGCAVTPSEGFNLKAISRTSGGVPERSLSFALSNVVPRSACNLFL